MPQNIKKLIEGVLERGYLMSLGTFDDGGVWVADVNYVFDEALNIYWISDPDARHSKAVLKNKKAAGTITVSNSGEDNLGVQFEGIAEKIEGARFDLAKKFRAKKHKPEPKEDEDFLEGDSWYVLKPNKIALICEKYFGFDKQVLELYEN